MLTKYAVTHDGLTTEYRDRGQAETHAARAGVEVVSIEFEDPAVEQEAQRKADAIDLLWRNATKWEQRFISGSAPTEIRFEAASGSTKAQEVCQWVRQLWASYYDERAWIEQQEELPADYVPTDFSAHGPAPYSVRETLYGTR